MEDDVPMKLNYMTLMGFRNHLVKQTIAPGRTTECTDTDCCFSMDLTF